MLQKTLMQQGILHLTLDRPAFLNALDSSLLEQLREAFLEAQRSDRVKAVLLTGNGRAFCAGADIGSLAELNSQKGFEFSENGQKIFNLLDQLGKPSLAAIHGAALGGGCELAMAATFRFAAENAFFGQPEIKLGVIPGFGGTQRLSRLIGKGKALELCLTGRKIQAQEALAVGLINEIVIPDMLVERAIAFLEGIICQPPLAVRSIMATIDQGYNLSMKEALAFEAAHFGLCCATRDKQEGVKAFIEKRVALFSGE